MSTLTYLPPAEGFLGLEEKDAATPEDARAVIVPFGLEASVSYGGGTSKGPAAILSASHEVELFDEELWCEAYQKYGVVTVQQPDIKKPIKAALDQLSEITSGLLAAGKFPLTLGGEHAITPGAIRPFLEKFPDLAVLHFDAHADLRDGYEGEPFSHASALRRVLDHPTVELVSVGIRNISQGEIPFLEANRHRIHIHWAKDRDSWSVRDIVAPLAGRPVYLTFDVDGFDASLMPATGTPEPGGLFWHDAMAIIRAASEVCAIVGADVNELAPIKGYHASDFLTAKLVYKILNFALAR